MWVSLSFFFHFAYSIISKYSNSFNVHVQMRWYVDFWLIQLFIIDVDVDVYECMHMKRLNTQAQHFNLIRNIDAQFDVQLNCKIFMFNRNNCHDILNGSVCLWWAFIAFIPAALSLVSHLDLDLAHFFIDLTSILCTDSIQIEYTK